MSSETIRDALGKVRCALDLKRRPVGVRFLFDPDQYEQADAGALSVRVPYCVMGKRATRGHGAKAVLENFGCMGAARALGIIEPDDYFTSGRHYQKLGLYRDLSVCKNIRRNMTLCRHKARGIMVKPLGDYQQDPDTPDVVLLVVNPYQAMRVIQAYTYIFGYHTSFKMSGNQAICSECTAYPFETNAINVSLLCSGTRFMGGWKDDELAIGFVFNKFTAVVDGLYATLNLTEPDRKKVDIETRLSQRNNDDLEIVYGRNYYTGHYLPRK
jgi:uncharacterized protein (DUF169 family)